MMLRKPRSSSCGMLEKFKELLSEKQYGSQKALIRALTSLGFDDVSQAKVSRMINKVGAVKIRNQFNQLVYYLPNAVPFPKTGQSIDSLTIKLRRNQTHIIIKTVSGGARIISRLIDALGEKQGILATIADDNTVLVIPTSTERIEEIMTHLSNHFNVA
ncbi:transcriptional regulator ArgR [Thalassotalea fusca]